MNNYRESNISTNPVLIVKFKQTVYFNTLNLFIRAKLVYWFIKYQNFKQKLTSLYKISAQFEVNVLNKSKIVKSIHSDTVKSK